MDDVATKALYPTMARAGAQSGEGATKDSPAEASARTLYPNMSPTGPAKRIHDNASTFGTVLAAGANRLQEALGLSQAERDAYVGMMAGAFADLSLNESPEAIHELAVRYSIDPADPKTVEAWGQQSAREGVFGFGRPEYERRQAAVRQYLSQSPDLAEMLSRTGLGSHPRVVHALLSRAPNLPKR